MNSDLDDLDSEPDGRVYDFFAEGEAANTPTRPYGSTLTAQ